MIHIIRNNRSLINKLSLIAILLAGAFFRFYGLNWDQGHLLHPDERFIVSVVEKIETPANLYQYLDAQTSTLNPRNRGIDFFAYGDFPLTLARLVSEGMLQLCNSLQKPDGSLCNSPGYWTSTQGILVTGRTLSALFSLGTLVWIFLISNSLFGYRTALMATFLGSMSILPVQLAHFFTADIFATFFISGSLWFLIRNKEPPTKADLVAAASFFAMAVACRINLLLFAVAFIPALIHFSWRHEKPRNIFAHFILGSGISLLAFYLILRLTIPSAFDGLLSFDTRWLENMNRIWAWSNDRVFLPPNVNWTGRTPWLYPLVNITYWGLGLLLAIVAFAGWAKQGRQLFTPLPHTHPDGKFSSLTIKLFSSRIFIPWLWVVVFFVWQGSFFITTMRYFLPLYPFLALFAAHILVQWWDSNRARPLGKIVVITVVGFTSLWMAAFFSIYQQPHSRIAASEWMQTHIPAAINLSFTEQGKSSSRRILPLPGPAQLKPGSPDHPAEIIFEVPTRGIADSLTFPKAKLSGEAGASIINLRIMLSEQNTNQLLLQKEITLTTTETAKGIVISLPELHLLPDKVYRLSLSSDRPGLSFHSSTVSSEYWDDALPLRTRSRPVSYHRVEMDLYQEESNQKYRDLIKWLDKTDYIVLSSNRLYASIPRQPLRYPLTTLYYHLLFSGKLGFEKTVELNSYPSIGQLVFPDQESNQSMGLKNTPTAERESGKYYFHLPPAEEAFSVYDHPRVLIFKKMSDFSIEKAKSQLSNVDIESAYRGFRPSAESAVPDGYLLENETWETQQKSGSWNRLFDFENSAFSFLSDQGAWLLFALISGWIGFPLMFTLLPGIADRGYGITRTVSLLIVGYISWLSSISLFSFSRQTILGAIFIFLVFNILAGIRKWSEIKIFLRSQRKLILVSEAVFIFSFLAALAVRSAQPELWHPWFGGEKPMDLSYLTAVIKSISFPPYDPWFSGGYINYYYFGFVLAAIPAKLMGTQPFIAYNIALAFWFALSCQAVFSIASNLHFRISRDPGRHRTNIALASGLLAVLLTMVSGNLDTIAMLFKEVYSLGTFTSLTQLPLVGDIAKLLHGSYLFLLGKATLNLTAYPWFWEASRMIPAVSGEAGSITEFPFFTFLYGDLHAYFLSLPLLLAFLGWMMSWIPEHSGPVLQRKPDCGSRHSFFSFFLPANVSPSSLAAASLLLGSLYATNSWSLPVGMIISAIVLIVSWQPGQVDLRWIKIICSWLVLVALSWLLFLPFSTQFNSAYSSVSLWKGSVTSLSSGFLVHGIFLVPVYLYIYTLLKKAHPSARAPGQSHILGLLVRYFIYGILLAGIFILFLNTLPMLILVAPLLLTSITLILRKNISPIEKFWLLMVFLGSAIIIGVELIVMDGDIDRMNTVFKFYYQSWILLSISAASAIVSLWTSEFYSGREKRFLQIITVLLIFSGLLYPLFAIKAKMEYRFDPDLSPGLDGMRFMKSAQYKTDEFNLNLNADFRAIRWLQKNVAGSPVIAVCCSTKEYAWGNRVTVFTGLPGIIGWRNHQKQQKSLLPDAVIQRRIDDIKSLYSGDPEKVRKIIQRYGIGYIYYGELERSRFPSAEKGFAFLNKGIVLEKVYDAEDTTIYKTGKSPTP